MLSLELRVLGQLQLRDIGGKDLCECLQPKRLALLVYLAHSPRRFHRRDTIVALFWPDLDPNAARNSLRQALHSLRRNLGRTILTNRGYEEIRVSDLLWSDTVAFYAALRQKELETALKLYRGDFLDGVHVHQAAPQFELWQEGERLRLRNQAVRAALSLAERDHTRGEFRQAVRWARAATRLDPDDESILCRLIDLLGRTGDRAGAIRAYDQFARRVRVEYDFEPGEETAAKIEALRARASSRA